MNHPDYIQRLQNDTGQKLTPLDTKEAWAWATPNSYCVNKQGQLITLNLEGCTLDQFTIGAELAQVTFLSLARNKISKVSFDAKVKNFDLEYLDLSYNQGNLNLIAIPSPALARLKYLYLFRAGLRKISFSGPLANLDTLHLAENKLTEITLPEKWPQLVTLYLHQNELQDFSLNPEEVPLLEYLSLVDNPLNQSIIATEIIDEGNCWENVKNALFAYIYSGETLNNEAKLIFVGDSYAGKTTLANILINDIFNEDLPSTHGILLNQWKIKRSDFPLKLKKGDPIIIPKEFILNIWDFGGQDYYHATHRLFLSQNSLFILVCNTQTKDTKKFWHETIKYYVKNDSPAIIVIKNKINLKDYIENSKDICIINKNEDDETFSQNIKSLKTNILRRVTKLNYFQKSYPTIYLKVREHIYRSRVEKKYLVLEEFKSMCFGIDDKNAISSESGFNTLLTFLHETGVIIYFPEKISGAHPSKYVFLDPKWVTDTIYAILSKQVKDNSGEFDNDHVFNVLRERRYDTVQDVPMWIDLLKNFKLIFQVNTGWDQTDARYIVPQYLKTEKNIGVFSSAYLPLSFILHYKVFMPSSIMFIFLAEYGSKHEENKYAKDALVFIEKDENKPFRVYVKCNSERRKIYVKIENNNANIKKRILNYLIDIYLSDEIYISQTIKEDDYRPIKGYKNKLNNIEDIQGMEERKPIFICYAAEDKELKDDLVKHLRGHLNMKLWSDEQIDIGDNWREVIKKKMQEAGAALLMVDAYFNDSKFIKEVELPEFLSRMEENKFRIIPILAREFDTKITDLDKYQFFSYTYKEMGDEAVDTSRRIPLDMVKRGGNEEITKRFNKYCSALANKIKGVFPKDKMLPSQ